MVGYVCKEKKLVRQVKHDSTFRCKFAKNRTGVIFCRKGIFEMK